MKNLRVVFISLIIAILTACAGPLTKADIEKIKIIGILNNFPEKPNLTHVGTTVFTNEYEFVEDTTYKTFLTTTIENLLKNKGYKVVVLEKDDKSSKVDAVLVVTPRDVYSFPYTMGYGFYERSLFGLSFKKSYVALNLTPTTNGEDRCITCYGESLTDLPLPEFKTKWNEIDENKKQELKIILNKDIEVAVNKAFSQTGL